MNGKCLMKPLVVVLLCSFSARSLGQSTSPDPQAVEGAILARMALPEGASEVITFSEFPIGTSIDTQYRDIGIIFGGSGPFISPDGANPTSPVLSGTPRFQGDITGTFVVPGTNRPTVVQSFTFDAGYFDEFGSTRIEWFDPAGNKLGQRINSILGIERLTFDGGNIASWRIGIVRNEPAGYAIDNVYFVPIGPSVLFREKTGDTKDGSWGFQKDEIPGFDHVGFHMENVVYESHPGYPSGTYVSADGTESVALANQNGVQAQHSRATFEHDSTIAGTTPVVDFEEIPVEEELARKMRNAIESAQGQPFQFIDYSLGGLEETLSPAAQKGGNGSFTCVGLVEWSAETAGHNGGQGFINDSFESFYVPVLGIEVPLLSPQLLNYAMKGEQLLQDASQWLQGLLDPVDFIVTDPLGRKLESVGGSFLSEIPNTFYSGDGRVEQFLIPNAIPGTYTIELVGINDDVFAAVGTCGGALGFSGFLAEGENSVQQLFVEPQAGTRGDVNGDGLVDNDDIQALIPRLNRFANGLSDPADLDGDGLISEIDLALLTQLVEILEVLQIGIDVIPGSEENPINLKSKGVVPVAVLGSDVFDVETIDLDTLRFGPDNARPQHSTRGHLEDVNGDGFIDLVSHYQIEDTGITAGLQEVCVTAVTIDGRAIKGCDQIRVIGE